MSIVKTVSVPSSDTSRRVVRGNTGSGGSCAPLANPYLDGLKLAKVSNDGVRRMSQGDIDRPEKALTPTQT